MDFWAGSHQGNPAKPLTHFIGICFLAGGAAGSRFDWTHPRPRLLLDHLQGLAHALPPVPLEGLHPELASAEAASGSASGAAVAPRVPDSDASRCLVLRAGDPFVASAYWPVGLVGIARKQHTEHKNMPQANPSEPKVPGQAWVN